jgi:hypothetical protein
MTHLPIRHLIVVAVALLGLGSTAHAGWITVTNDTKQTIVIQETSGPLHRPLKGKCIKLQPGESHREFSLFGGTRDVVIYDADAPNTPLVTDTMEWDKNDIAFTVKLDGKKVSLGPAEKKK